MVVAVNYISRSALPNPSKLSATDAKAFEIVKSQPSALKLLNIYAFYGGFANDSTDYVLRCQWKSLLGDDLG